MEAGLGQWARSYWHSGDIECYTERARNSMGVQILAEERLALKCFSRITLAAVLKMDGCVAR